jgi:REP element-mobilizing transposase RayT
MKVLIKCPRCSHAMWRGTVCDFCHPLGNSPYRAKGREIGESREGAVAWGDYDDSAFCWQTPYPRVALASLHCPSCSRHHSRPALPCHTTWQRRAEVFFSASDYAAYRDRLSEAAHEAGVAVWAWQLMPNHVHLVLAPEGEDGLRRALARVHRSYGDMIPSRRKGAGHFWQRRFGAVATDEPHLGAAFRYVTLNPARARLVRHAEDWWSSARSPGLMRMTP